MPDAGAAGGVHGAHLEHHVDERARLEVFAMEPLVEHVEDGQQLFSGSAPRLMAPASM